MYGKWTDYVIVSLLLSVTFTGLDKHTNLQDNLSIFRKLLVYKFYNTGPWGQSCQGF
jgi:hypothetical protein